MFDEMKYNLSLFGRSWEKPVGYSISRNLQNILMRNYKVLVKSIGSGGSGLLKRRKANKFFLFSSFERSTSYFKNST